MTVWAPLAESDPVPGDPDRLDASVGSLRGTAQALREQAAAFRGASGDGSWTGPAADEFRAKSQKILQTIDKLHERYRRVGEALALYSPAPTCSCKGHRHRGSATESRSQGCMVFPAGPRAASSLGSEGGP